MGAPYPHFLPDLAREIESLRAPDCDSYLSPSGLRRMFLLMIRGHWSSGGNYGPDFEESLKCLEWSPVPGEGTIDIELDGTPAADEANVPAIFVSLGNFRFRKLHLGNQTEVSLDNSKVIYTVGASAQLLVRHVARSLDTAFDMGWSTLCFLLGFNEALVEIMGNEASMQPELIGEPLMESAPPQTEFRVDVGVTLNVNLSVATTVESHVLTRVFEDLHPTT